MAVTGVTASTTNAMHNLAAHDLRLDRGARSILNGLSFNIESGQALVLRGANGSGKTSLLRILAGLTLPDAGAVVWNGEKLRALSVTWRNTALYLGHTNALKDDFTAEENLQFNEILKSERAYCCSSIVPVVIADASTQCNVESLCAR